MIKIRKNNERGKSNFGWLNSYHTFSFGNYFDRNHMGFGNLRVINDDFVESGYGFDSHPHRDMEILTYVVEGELIHRDSMGNSYILEANYFQKITAGTGIVHSEYNNSQNERLRFIQIWIIPDNVGHEPNYEQVNIDKNSIKNNLTLVASGAEKVSKNILNINQDADIYISILENSEELQFESNSERILWLQLISGKLNLNDNELQEGDGASITEENLLNIKSFSHSEFLLFDLAN